MSLRPNAQKSEMIDKNCIIYQGRILMFDLIMYEIKSISSCLIFISPLQTLKFFNVCKGSNRYQCLIFFVITL